MRTLEIPNFPDELYQQIEKLARIHGRSVGEEAAEFLLKGLADDKEREAMLMEEIRVDREAMAKRGVWITPEEIRASKNWGRE